MQVNNMIIQVKNEEMMMNTNVHMIVTLNLMMILLFHLLVLVIQSLVIHLNHFEYYYYSEYQVMKTLILNLVLLNFVVDVEMIFFDMVNISTFLNVNKNKKDNHKIILIKQSLI